jgi:PAS domain S-box-containing protein
MPTLPKKSNAVPANRQDIATPLISNRPFGEHVGRCLRSLSELGCELEQALLDAVITTDPSGRIVSCSPAASDILGMLPSEALGRDVSDFYAGGTAEARQVMQRLKAEGRLRNYVTDFVSASGRRIPVALSASIIRNPEGKILGTLGVARNLTEIRRLEDELAAKNRFMANILQDSADAILTLDPNDIVTSWNRGAESIFGYGADEMIGKPVSILLTPELREAQELKQIAERVQTYGAVRSYQTERMTKDGRRIQVIFTRTAIRDDQGRIVGASAVLKDVTAYRNMERQLADAEHLATLGELSAGLAHEVKNPLAGIKGAIEVIRDSVPENDVHREILGDVLHEVNRIDKIVRDLLTYAKPKPPSLTTIHLTELAQRIIAMVRKSAGNDALVIRLHKCTEMPGFTGDEIQLEQVLLNLLLNAQKAMPSGGKINVWLRHKHAEGPICFEVEDDGPGIPEEVRKKLFQPFFTTRTDGTGLGLATCMKNVQYHGGTIEVESEVGRGTRFIVTIPLVSRL